MTHETRRRAAWIIAIVALSFVVRAGTAHFVGARLDDAGWFQFGSYKNFDVRAQAIIDGRESVFFLSDPERTDLIQYPPGFPIAIGIVYMLAGERSAYAVHRVQWPLDALITPLLILGITVTAFGWRPAYAAGTFAALSPLLTFYGVSPSADAPTTWVVLAAVWLMLIAAMRQKWQLALFSGLALGVACWIRVNPLFLIGAWAVAILVFVPAHRKRRAGLCAAIVFGTILLVAPLVIRNVVVFREFVLTGLNVGSNFWEGLGETEFGRENGFDFGDQLMVEQERNEMGLPADYPITPTWPDGIRRDRERSRRSLAFIFRHPLWYGGVILGRTWWMLKIAGEPGPYYGTAGINCTPSKCLSDEWRGGAASLALTVIGASQSVYRYLAIPLAVAGLWFGFRQNKQMAGLLAATAAYYLFASSATHTELRYVLPMHAILTVFSGVGFHALTRYAWMLVRGRE